MATNCLVYEKIKSCRPLFSLALVLAMFLLSFPRSENFKFINSIKFIIIFYTSLYNEYLKDGCYFTIWSSLIRIICKKRYLNQWYKFTMKHQEFGRRKRTDISVLLHPINYLMYSSTLIWNKQHTLSGSTGACYLHQLYSYCSTLMIALYLHSGKYSILQIMALYDQ